MKISIISPCYNESDNIEKFVYEIFKIFKKYKDFELIIIDDSSTDGTTKILLKLVNQFKNLKVIFRSSIYRDLSLSCFQGIRKAKFKTIVIMDSDMQHQPKDVIKLYKKYKKYKSDIVVGTRSLLKRNPGLGYFRQKSSILIILILNYFLGKRTSDPMSGFFLFNKKIYNPKNKYFSRGFKILVDLIYGSRKKIKVNDVSITFKLRKNNQSKMNLKVLFYILKFIYTKKIDEYFNS